MGKKASPGYRIRQDAREQDKQRLLEQSEPETTRQYFDTVSEIYRDEGLLPAIKYEVGSTLYSLKKRLVSFFGKRDEKTVERRLYLLRGRSKEAYILRQRKKKQLEDKSMIALIVGIIGGLPFLSPNITGNSIANMNLQASNIAGAIFFIIGLVGAFFLLRSKKEKL